VLDLAGAVVTHPDFGAALDQLAGHVEDQFDALTNGGWDTILTLLDSLLDGQVFGVDIPLVGQQLKQLGNFVDRLPRR